MSLCPQCGSDLADENSPCAECREAAGPRTEPPSESDRRFPFWVVLPWCLLGASLLFWLPHLRSHPLPLARPESAPVAAPAAPAPVSQAEAKAAPVPLSVTLSSSDDGKHVRVGTPVAISAYAALPPGESAALAVSYDKNGGPKSLLALAQGSLSSTTWTPLTPGHYSFTATATDSGKISAFSRPLFVWVDAPPSAPLPPLRLRSVRTAALPAPVRRRPARRRAARSVPAAASPQPYHVAAATFPFPQNASILAGALRRRGFHAFVRTGVPGQASRAYTVETGDYLSPSDAQKQMRRLQHDGYPSYLFRLH